MPFQYTRPTIHFTIILGFAYAFQTITAAPTLSKRAPVDEATAEKRIGRVIGAVCGGILALIVIIICVVFTIKRIEKTRNRNEKKGLEKGKALDLESGRVVVVDRAG